MCRFENNNLEILRTNCDEPWRLENKKYNQSEFALAEFEDGFFYFFYLSENLEKVNGEYVQYRLKNPNFFKSIEYSLTEGFNLKKFKSVIFKNGVLMPMVTLSKVPQFDIEIEQLNVKTAFRLRKVVDDFLCKTENGKMLSNYPTKKKDYELVATFRSTVSFSMLNKITKKLYKIIQFISTDYNAPIENIVVKTNIGELIYYHNDINITSDPVVKRYNYINNCAGEVKELAQNLVDDKCDISFLSLIDRAEFIDNDYWILGQSLEANIPDNIDKEIHNSEVKNEINIYKKLREEIHNTIKIFEQQNGEIDVNRRSFILSLIEMAKFRRKAEFVFEKYSNFAKKYSKYRELNDIEMNELSKKLQLARNTIHGLKIKPDDKEKAELAAELCTVGLYIYILEKSGASSACIFNFLQCFCRGY